MFIIKKLEKYNKVLNEIEDIENMLKKQRDQGANFVV